MNNPRNNYRPFSFTKIPCTSCKLELCSLHGIKLFAVSLFLKKRKYQAYGKVRAELGFLQASCSLIIGGTCFLWLPYVINETNSFNYFLFYVLRLSTTWPTFQITQTSLLLLVWIGVKLLMANHTQSAWWRWEVSSLWLVLLLQLFMQRFFVLLCKFFLLVT